MIRVAMTNTKRCWTWEAAMRRAFTYAQQDALAARYRVVGRQVAPGEWRYYVTREPRR